MKINPSTWADFQIDDTFASTLSPPKTWRSGGPISASVIDVSTISKLLNVWRHCSRVSHNMMASMSPWAGFAHVFRHHCDVT